MRLIGGEWKRRKACSRPVLIRRGLDSHSPSKRQTPQGCSRLAKGLACENVPRAQAESAARLADVDRCKPSRNPVAIAEWFHLFPSRTQSLSTHTSKVLGWRRPGRIESCWLMTHPQGCVFILESRHLCFDVQQGLLRHLLEHDVRIDYAHVMVEGIPQDAVPRIADVELFRSCIV